MPSIFNRSRWLAVGCALFLGAVAARAEITDPARLLPDSCLVYAELRDPPRLLSTILDHPLRSQVEAMPQFLELRKNPEFQKLQIGLRFVEFKLQKLWRPALEGVTRGGITVGADPVSQGAVLLVRAEDAAFLQQARDTLIELARGDSENGDQGDAIQKDQGDAIQKETHREVDVYRIGDIAVAVHDEWLIVTNQDQLGKAVLDRVLGDKVPSLADVEVFQAARKSAAEASHGPVLLNRDSDSDEAESDSLPAADEPDQADGVTAWAWVHLAPLREHEQAKEFFRGHAEDFGGEMILGGVLAAVADAPYLTAKLQVAPTGVRLTAAVPAETSKLIENAAYFYGAEAAGQAPAPVHVSGQIASVRAYRDLAELWLKGPDYFDERVNAEMARMESELSTLAGGRSFTEDFLGAIGPRIQFVIANQDYQAADVPTPVIKLPGFAAIITLRDPEKSGRLFKIAYQQVVGFINIAAGQQGYPPLELNSMREGEASFVTATYLREDLERYAEEHAVEGAARIQANFSPTASFVDEYFVLSSTRELAREVIEKLQAPASSTEPAAADDFTLNTALAVDAAQLHAILDQNREHLVNQNMLQEGHDQETAAREIGGLLTVLDWLQGASLGLARQDNTLQLTLEIRL
jgi:hypothetical protein